MTNILKQTIGKSRRRAAILHKLSEYAVDGTQQTELRDRLETNDQLGFNENLNDLLVAAIVELKNNRIRFSTPVYRLLVLLAKETSTLYPA